MSISQTGFNLLSAAYHSSAAIAGAAALTYLAGRFVPVLQLPPLESAKFTAIGSLIFVLGKTFIQEMQHTISSSSSSHSHQEKKKGEKRTFKNQQRIENQQVRERWTLKNELAKHIFFCVLMNGFKGYISPASPWTSFAKTCGVAFGTFLTAQWSIESLSAALNKNYKK